MFNLLADVLGYLLDALIGKAAEEGSEWRRWFVVWILLILVALGIAGAAGLGGFGTVWRVLLGLGAAYLALVVATNHPWRD
jgi:hypothetical protein